MHDRQFATCFFASKPADPNRPKKRGREAGQVRDAVIVKRCSRITKNARRVCQIHGQSRRAHLLSQPCQPVLGRLRFVAYSPWQVQLTEFLSFSQRLLHVSAGRQAIERTTLAVKLL